MGSDTYLYLTTTGRRSRLPREIEIWFTHLNGRYYVIAEYTTSNWVRNIMAEPRVRVRVDGGSFSGHASEVKDASLRDRVQELSRKKYGWGDGLVVEIAPDSPEAERDLQP